MEVGLGRIQLWQPPFAPRPVSSAAAIPFTTPLEVSLVRALCLRQRDVRISRMVLRLRSIVLSRIVKASDSFLLVRVRVCVCVCSPLLPSVLLLSPSPFPSPSGFAHSYRHIFLSETILHRMSLPMSGRLVWCSGFSGDRLFHATVLVTPW